MIKNNMLESLNKLKEKDIYSMLLYVLYRLKDDDKYSTLSYLIWCLDKNNLLNFLTLFEGTEIKVPKLFDLKMIVGALQLYQLTHFEKDKLSLEDAMREINTKELPEEELKTLYFRLCDLMVNDAEEVINV